MPITEIQLIEGIEAKNGFPLDHSQREAICYGDGPLLVAAGPGTGKTEVLVSRCLKHIVCDNVNPGSIMITTFTEKAAKNLEDRLSETLLFLINMYPELAGVDPSALRIGTLHGLCNDILQEYRYVDYHNQRLLDEVENSLLIHKSVVGNIQHLTNSLFTRFSYLFGNRQFGDLGKWDWALQLQTLFGRLVEDQIDLNSLLMQGNSWAALYEANEIYEQALAAAHACDFSRLLKKFQEFLETGQGNLFLNGDANEVRLPLTHILVDEYQDTNPIQESIYLRLADNLPHNITVVGDDDQALYRFRGGTVECMVGFPAACNSRWNIFPHTIFLADNHRSDSDIVDWCNNYISSFPRMNLPNVRISGKPPLNSSVGRTGNHPAVSLIRESRVTDCAVSFATLVRELFDNGVIQDFSQCVLLLRSTKNSTNFALPYVNALQGQQIPVYNPRSKDYLEQIEVQQCLGAFIRIIDPQLQHLATVLSNTIRQLVQGWVNEFDNIIPQNPALADYIAQSAQAIRNKLAGEKITPAMPTILYRIISHQPFTGYQANPEMDLRISKLTRLFESFCSQYGRELLISNIQDGELPGWWYSNFYYGLCGYLSKKGLDDDEEEEIICPSGYFPIMTVHQAKGLEFDFVFVGNLGSSVSSSSSHRLEEDLRQFRQNPPAVTHPINEAAWHDDIRQNFVAFSRAKFSLILLATDSQLRKHGHETASFGNNGGNWVRQNIIRL